MKAQNERILTAYFSWGGNTRAVAEHIHKAVGGGLFEIKTAAPYPKEYRPTTEAAKREQQANARPELTGRVQDMASFDIIFLGYPNWWSSVPMALFTFLECYDLSGKTIIPFCTHGGGGIGRSVKDIKKLCPGATVREELVIGGGSAGRAADEVSAWLRRLGMLN